MTEEAPPPAAPAPPPPVKEKGFLEQYWKWLAALIVLLGALMVAARKKGR